MTLRIFHVPFQLLFVLMTLIVMTTPFQKDFLPRLIMLTVQRLEYNESSFQNLNCSATRPTFGNGAEFMVNGRTVEHISFNDNTCYNSKREECTTDNCQCFPNDNVYIYNYENKEQVAELTLGCQMRFADNTTSNLFQVITSVKINGSAMDKYEYDVKILKENKDGRTHLDDKEINSGFVDISLWLPVTCGVLFAVSIVLTVSIYYLLRRRRRLKRRERWENDFTELPLLLCSDLPMFNLQDKIRQIEAEQNEVIPRNIKVQIEIQIKEWEKKDETFVSTRASDYVMDCLRENSCLTLTGPSGGGKSFISRHTALMLQKKGYQIIPVNSPTDIRRYYQPGKPTVFIVDDICGKFTANQQQIENWKHMLPVIKLMFTDKCCKIIVTCRLQVYKDEKFNTLLPFKSCECNLMSDKLCLTTIEKASIANKYIGTSLDDIDELSQNCEFFPLLCSLYHMTKQGDVHDLFQNPFVFYQNKLDSFSRPGDEGNYKLCSLALLVLFNNQIHDKWFQGRETDTQRRIKEVICYACKIDSSTTKAKLKNSLDTLDSSFICKQYGVYSTVHDKLFDFLAHYFGHKMIECLIDHGDSDLVQERFIWQNSPAKKNNNIDFIIEIPDDYLESYLERLKEDWLAGKVEIVFSNANMKISSFRQKLLEFLTQLDKSQQEKLVCTKDRGCLKAGYASGNTPLVIGCDNDYTDMVQWMLLNKVDVNQGRFDGVTGLVKASQQGHTDIVKLLLEHNPIVDWCDMDGRSPLFMASQQGHTQIVKLLLEKNSNIDLCDMACSSPLFIASQKGHTDIVKLLLEHNPNVDLCDIDGLSPLFMASQQGYTGIVKLLLEHNPIVDLCDMDGRSPLFMASQQGNTDIVRLLLEKTFNIDLCDNNGFTPLIQSCSNNHTSIVKLFLQHNPNINAQTLDGGNALYFSVMHGNTDMTKLLLSKHADCNICIYSKQLMIDIFSNHPDYTLDIAKKSFFDSLVNNTSSQVTDYVRKKSADYTFDVVAGSSPLHLACFMGSIDIVCCLLDHNAEINMTKEDGTTPLFYACEVGHEDVVRLLLDKGAVTQICRLNGKTPLGIAIDNGHTSIVYLVTEHTKKEDKLSD